MLFYVQPSSSGTAVDLAGVGRIVCPGAIAGCFAALGTGFTGLEAGHPGVGGTLGAVSGGVAALRFFRLGYRLETDRVLVTDGVLFSTVRIFPLAALQTASVSADPLQRLCGLRTLRLTAAGSEVALPGLTASEAVRLAGLLLEGGGQP